CVLFEMLTGRGAFARDDLAKARAALLSATVPELPGAGKQFPAELGRVVGRCLAREPADRYQSAGDLAHDLRAFLHGPRPSQRRRFWLVVAPVLALLLALAAGGVYLLTRGPGPAEEHAPPETAGAIDTVAVLPFENVGGDPAREYLSDGLSESVINSLS